MSRWRSSSPFSLYRSLQRGKHDVMRRTRAGPPRAAPCRRAAWGTWPDAPTGGNLEDVSTADPETATSPITPGHFREVLGHYPTGVTVVTGMVEDRPVGMVVGTFSSVSLD